jgi:O-antigen/teichoic acid export membrane protein
MSVKLLVRNIVSQSILQVANLVLPFITIPYITKIIGPDKFGVINYAAAFVTYFTLVVNFSFDMNASRAVAQNPNDQDFINKLFSETLYTKIFLFFICALSFFILLAYLPQLQSEKEVAVYSFLVVIGWVITPNWLFQGKQQLDKIAIFNLVAKLIFTVSIFFVIHDKQHYKWQPLILSISQIVVGLVSLLYAMGKYNVRVVKLPLANIFTTLKQGKELFFSLVTISLYSNSTIIILGFFLDSTNVGYYSAAFRLIITAITILSIPLNQALFPFISSSFSINYNKGINELQRILPVCLVFSFLYSAVFFLFAPFIIHLFYGDKFNESIIIFRTLSMVPFLVSVNSFLGIHALLNLKKDKLFFNITLISSVAGILATTVLGYYFGIRGGAFSWLIAEIFNCLLFYIALKRLEINLYNPYYFSLAYFKLIGVKVYRNIESRLAGRGV